MDEMMELDMDVHHHGTALPIAVLSTMADVLPGLGIVAAVLGVVITMGALGGPPEEIGKKVAAALVGTFLGILLCYGLIGPLAANMSKGADEEHGVAENFVITKDNMQELKEQLQKTVREVPNFAKMKNNIDMTVTNEGLRIELTESSTGTFFDSGSTKISGDGADLLIALAGELGKLQNNLALEGHTDFKQYPDASTYGNWELSTDRATPRAAW
jgi:flagellar motor protein MotB